ncbi:MAG TPA: hypothetical protein VN523_04825 [Hyphomicrobiaceae bacterium]|jgi:hypothetical protein|nr:hypothetical protein [Hyphomicrobiaceae bacterium]
MRKDQENPSLAAEQIAAGAKIIQFARKPKACQQAPEIVDPLRRLEDEDEHRRTLQNLAATLIIVALIAAGFWLIDHLRSSARIEACLEAGHRNCLPNLEHAR